MQTTCPRPCDCGLVCIDPIFYAWGFSHRSNSQAQPFRAHQAPAAMRRMLDKDSFATLSHAVQCAPLIAPYRATPPLGYVSQPKLQDSIVPLSLCRCGDSAFLPAMSNTVRQTVLLKTGTDTVCRFIAGVFLPYGNELIDRCEQGLHQSRIEMPALLVFDPIQHPR